MRKFNIFNSTTTVHPSYRNSNSVVEVGIPLLMLKSIVNKTFITIGSGVLILLVTLALAVKFKVALIMLPISIYLIGQYFLLSNHITVIRNQRIVFDPKTNDVMIEYAGKNVFSFNLDRDIHSLNEFKSVQKNDGVEFGYWQLNTQQITVNIPHIVTINPQTKPFFDKLDRIDKQIETKLFPII